MKRRKIRIGRIILAFVIYFIIGIIPIKISHIRTDQAKSDLAQELLAKHDDYPEETKEILEKAATDPQYARTHIHVWDPDGRGHCPYDTYVGGGVAWRKNAYIIPNTGEKTGGIILRNEIASEFLYIFSIVWFIGIPFGLIYSYTQDKQSKCKQRTQQ